MKPMTCAEIDERIDLFAAGECEGAEAIAIRAHLAGCPRCARTEREARQFLDLVDMRLQEPDRLERLLDRIDREANPRPASIAMPSRRKVRTTRQRWFAIAASILLPIGVGIWLTPAIETEKPAPEALQVSLLSDPERGPLRLAPAPFPEPMPDKAPTYALETFKMSAKNYRAFLARAEQQAELVPPPEVDLLLQFSNRSDHPIRVLLDDPRAELGLSLSGPGAVRLKAPAAANPFAGLSTIEIPPHSTRSIPIRRLLGGTRAQPVGWYWTEPGTYRLRVWLHAPVESAGPRRIMTLGSTTLPIRVVD